MATRLCSAILGLALALVTFSSVSRADEALPDLDDVLHAARSHAGDDWIEASTSDLSLAGTRLGKEPLPDPEPCQPCCLKWDVMLGMWLSGFDGDARIAGRDIELEIKPKDLIDLLEFVEFVLEGRISATYGNWLFYVGGMTMDVGNEISGEVDGPIGGPRNVAADVDLTLSIVEAGVGYCLGKCVTGQDCCGREKSRVGYAYVGARYFSIDLEFTTSLAILPGTSDKEDFVDPIVGGIVAWKLGNKWGAVVDANIGGFGVGSDFAWKARAAVNYQFTRSFYAELGFMVLDIDAERGSFKWDVTMYGPYLGIGFRF